MGVQVGHSLITQEPVSVTEAMLQRHALIFGSSGFGKTSLAGLLIRQQMEGKDGASLVAIDPKVVTVRNLRGLCEAVDLEPERVIVFDPTDPDYTPPMNLFQAAASPYSMAVRLTEMLGFDPEKGIRMNEFSMHAFVLVGWHGLPPTDALRLLRDDGFREHFLISEPTHPVDERYEDTVAFFRDEYAGDSKIKAADKNSTYGSIRARMEMLTRHLLFRRGFNAPTTAVRFDSLFHTKGAVLVSMGKGSELSNQERTFLGTLFVELLFEAAVRTEGKRPVILAIDEVHPALR